MARCDAHVNETGPHHRAPRGWGPRGVGRGLLSVTVLLALAAPVSAAAAPGAGAAGDEAFVVPPALAFVALLFRGRVRGQGAAALLANGTRRRLIALVRREPGLTPSAIARGIGVSHNAVLYHVRLLAGAGLVRVARRGGPRSFMHVYPTERAPTGFARTAALELTSPAARAVATSLLDAGKSGCTVQGLVTLTGHPETTVRHHVRRFQRAGLLVTADAGTHLVYVVPEAAREALGLALSAPRGADATSRVGVDGP